MTNTIAHSALLLSLGLTGSCGHSDEGLACISDDDCDDRCSRVGECLTASSSIEIRLSWTVNQQSPSPSRADVCGPIRDLELSFESDSASDETIVYFPVPCELGRVFYDRMPDRLSQVRVTAYGEAETPLTVEFRNIESRSSDFRFDFSL